MEKETTVDTAPRNFNKELQEIGLTKEQCNDVMHMFKPFLLMEFDAKECLTSLAYWKGNEFVDGFKGHTAETMRPYLITTKFLNKIIKEIQGC